MSDAPKKKVISRAKAAEMGLIPMSRARAKQLGGQYWEHRKTFFRTPDLDRSQDDEAWGQLFTPEGMLEIAEHDA